MTSEIALARLEASEKVSLAVASIAGLVGAAIFIIVALIFLLQGLVELLILRGFPAFAASFAVGGAIAIVALIAVVLALRNLTIGRLKPKRTLDQFSDVNRALRGRAG